MAKAKNSSTVSAHIPNEMLAELDARAARLGWSRSKYVARILEQWYERGCPSIHDLDHLANRIELAAAEESKKYHTFPHISKPS